MGKIQNLILICNAILALASSQTYEENSIDQTNYNDWHDDQDYNTQINQIAETEEIFQRSSNDSTLILTDFSTCLASYNIYDCMKMLLLSKVKGLVMDMQHINTTGSDYPMMYGLINFKWVNNSEDINLESFDNKAGPSVSRELNEYLLKLFKSRSLQISLFPGLGLELEPKSISDENGLVCFSAKTFKETSFNSSGKF